MTYTEPLLLVLLVLLGTGVALARRSPGWLLRCAGVVGLVLVTSPAADWAMSRPLARAYPIGRLPAGDAQAIVVLSAEVHQPTDETPYPVPDDRTYVRCLRAAWLYTHWRAMPVLASGGVRIPGQVPFAETMRGILLARGVPEASVLTEDDSRSTHENAVFSARLLKARGITTIVLVTDARSLLRAELCFRKEGLTVIPAASDDDVPESMPAALMPGWQAVRGNEATLHEMVGLVYYKVRGWI